MFFILLSICDLFDLCDLLLLDVEVNFMINLKEKISLFGFAQLCKSCLYVRDLFIQEKTSSVKKKKKILKITSNQSKRLFKTSSLSSIPKQKH